jgi:hypothetical protein
MYYRILNATISHLSALETTRLVLEKPLYHVKRNPMKRMFLKRKHKTVIGDIKFLLNIGTKVLFLHK